MTALPQIARWTPLPRAEAARPALARTWPVLVLAPLFVLLAWRSWGTWPDPLIDFGRELYVPWRMAEGDVLYRDLAYFNGPLSPAVNTLWFGIFGASLRTLVVANLAIAAATTALLYGMLRQTSNRNSATIACAAFVALSVFSQFTRIRNYNFVCPYSHEMTHGLFLSLLALAATWGGNSRSLAPTAIAGVLLGLVLLTKPEMAVAAAIGVGAGVARRCSKLAACTEAKRGMSPFGRVATAHGGWLLLGAAIPPAAAIAWLSRSMPVGDAVAGCFGAWRMAGIDEIRQLAFYRRGLGTLHLGDSLALAAVSSARWAVAIGAAYVLMHATRRLSPSRRRAVAATFGGALAILLFDRGFSWPLLERAFPVILAVLIAWNVWEAARLPYDCNEKRIYALRAIWALFAVAFLAKIALYSRISHYGFALGAPAIAVVLVAVFHWLPAAAQKCGLPGDVIQWFAAPLVLAYVLAYQCQQSVLVDRAIPMGAASDRFAAPAHAGAIARAEQQILHRVAPDETLAVLPEGVMLNYLTRRAAPTRYITFMPPELHFFGEANMLAALQEAPADWVLVAPRDFKEYGMPPFGQGYADSIAQWIADNYEPVHSWREADGGDNEWRLLRRRAQPHAPAKPPGDN